MRLSLLSLFLILLLVTTKTTTASGCIGNERNALFDLKATLKDHQGVLSSWRGLNCCSWYGVTCNKTGHIIKLNLRNNESMEYALTGDISPSLVNLTHLEYLDLHGNDFGGGSIPEFIGSFKNLRHLDLSFAGFGGKIPPHLGNLSKLNYLDISIADRIFTSSSSVDNLLWLSGLSSLAYLDMSSWNFSAASDWLESLNMLAFLEELHLSTTHLPPTDLNSLSQSNFTFLNKVDLPLVSESCYEHKLNPIYNDEDTHAHDVLLYVVSGLGFGLGFSAIWWLLIFNEAVRKLYFQSIDSINVISIIMDRNRNPVS
uniref:Leucine-rich repeat-containing N-terminal plant-type domain-containing protein n=1 Tax=Setaria viridis TaxID=4556 RepID=A0A4U6UW29_SETVI|nr:hypothetical protein SEVIR_4G022100v2 [Setaria viridis]